MFYWAWGMLKRRPARNLMLAVSGGTTPLQFIGIFLLGAIQASVQVDDT